MYLVLYSIVRVCVRSEGMCRLPDSCRAWRCVLFVHPSLVIYIFEIRPIGPYRRATASAFDPSGIDAGWG